MSHRVDQNVADLLDQHRSSRVYFEPLVGNNGDKLIEMGARQAMKSAALHLVDRPEQAELVIINGGGGMAEPWYDKLQTLCSYLRRYPDLAIIVLPNTFQIQTTDLSGALAQHPGPITIFVRERFSMEHLMGLKMPGHVHVAMDHDMAFHLQGSDYVQDLQAKCCDRRILIVERGDAETVTSEKHGGWRVPMKQFIPGRIKLPIKRFMAKRRARATGHRTAFAKEGLRRIELAHPHHAHLPVTAMDISHPGVCGFNEFSRLIAEAAVVVTTRMHVGVLSSFLGKPTYIHPGVYYKIRGVYELSLATLPHVSLLEQQQES